jgi:hypothetical protein
MSEPLEINQQTIIENLKDFPKEKLPEVHDFILFLKSHYAGIPPAKEVDQDEISLSLIDRIPRIQEKLEAMDSKDVANLVARAFGMWAAHSRIQTSGGKVDRLRAEPEERIDS